MTEQKHAAAPVQPSPTPRQPSDPLRRQRPAPEAQDHAAQTAAISAAIARKVRQRRYTL